MLDFSKFSETRTVIDQISYKVKYYLLRRLFRGLNPFFMNPSDIITRFTIAYGVHERMVFELIKFISSSEHNDFLIDIGANIGLTSAQTAGRYKKYYLVEPNPIVFNVLKANLAIHLPAGSFETYNFGLSDKDMQTELMIPKDNWGGAFILEGNAYEQKTLLSKDGKKSLSEDDYLKQKIVLRDSEVFIEDVIERLKREGLSKGLVKVDVEGYEMKVLTKIIPKLIAAQISCYIIFEQWDDAWNRDLLDNLVDGSLDIWLLDEKDPDVNSISGVFHLLKSFFSGNRIQNRLKQNASTPMVGNILVKI